MVDARSGSGPELSVVLSSLGNYQVLQRVLDGYDAQDAAPSSFEMLVVVDTKDPDPAAVDRAIGNRGYPVRRLTGRAPGLSANRNTGWRAARARLVLFTDNDTIPVAGLVREHLAWHRSHPEDEVAVLGHVRWAPELKQTAFMRWLDRGMQFDFGTIQGSDASWGHLYGANSSMKRAFIERVGDWDEVNLPYGYEDLDWAYRASRYGLRVRYNRRAIVHHLKHEDLDRWRQNVRRLARTERQFHAMHPELEPWFFAKFSRVMNTPPSKGRSARLAEWVPRWVPWLGPTVWAKADRYWRQQLAPHFMAAWYDAESEIIRVDP